MTVLKTALEALRQYQQSVQREGSADLSSAPSVDCEKSERSEKRSVELVEVPCRCSKWAFPRIHCREDRERAIREWNWYSRHKLEWIQ
jgi:hypothetical protein